MYTFVRVGRIAGIEQFAGIERFDPIERFVQIDRFVRIERFVWVDWGLVLCLEVLAAKDSLVAILHSQFVTLLT
jgi:hypothetical protein